jgi:hypothetical protein
MDVVRILKTVEALNHHIRNSLVRKGSMMTAQGAEISRLINVGKMIYDAQRGVEKPDAHWVKAILELHKIKETQGQEILNFMLEELQHETKPAKFTVFSEQWEKWCARDNGVDLAPDHLQLRSSSDNVKRLLKVADHLIGTDVGRKVQQARIVDAHVEHIVTLFRSGQPDKAREYLEAIKPIDMHNPRQVLEYMAVNRGLQERLPEMFNT